MARRFLVTGKVQGVYFRQSTRLEAQRLKLGGLARNLPDGSVEVIAEGSAQAIESLREWLHRGPPAARVAAVRELEVPPRDSMLGTPSERLDDDESGHPTRAFRVE